MSQENNAKSVEQRLDDLEADVLQLQDAATKAANAQPSAGDPANTKDAGAREVLRRLLQAAGEVVRTGAANDANSL